MGPITATKDSFLHWTDNCALVYKKGLVKANIKASACPLCSLYRHEGICVDCPLEKHGMQCEDVMKGTPVWREVNRKLCVLPGCIQPRVAVEDMTLCLLLVYYAIGGREEWK